MSRSEEEPVLFHDRRRIKSVDDTVDESGEPNLERAPSYLERLEKEKEENDARLKEYIAAYKTKMADVDEFRKKLEKDVAILSRRAFGDLLTDLFPVIDNVDRAIASLSGEGSDPVALDGVRMLREGLIKALVKAGLEITDFTGKPFDPEMAQAVGTEPVDDEALDNVVTEQLAPGYIHDGRVLRPAMVRVGQKG